MAKALLSGFTVHNVEPCPKCQAEKWAWVNETWRMFEMHCNECDYKAPGALVMYGANQKKNPEAFKEQTRHLFNHWNQEVAKELNIKPKRVRLLKNDL